MTAAKPARTPEHAEALPNSHAVDGGELHAASRPLPLVAITRSDLPGTGLERLARHAHVIYWHSPARPTPADLARLCANATGLICQSTDRIDDPLLTACPDLRVISTIGVGCDHIDLAALGRHHVAAGNTPGVLTETTADLAFALILAAGRRLNEGIELARSGDWEPGDINLLLGQDIHGATLGIVGYGAIGRAVARRARGFGMRVLHHTQTPKPDEFSEHVPLAELLAMSDFVSLHTPLTDQTAGLIGDRELALMKRTAVLVNTARGGVVDQLALVRALQQHRIFAAGLDVTAVEPTPAGDVLLTLPNCIVLPHIGSASLSTRTAMVDHAVDNVIAGLAGQQLPHPVTPSSPQIGSTVD
jgi:lactate dehydrogenase-like 2-hydroxyacid dehydrogenase